MKTFEEIKNTPNLLVRQSGIDGGMGVIYKAGKPYASVIWSNGGGWEHISMAPFNRRTVPDWDDMCRLKDMFFYENETAVQFHPAKSEYVNNVQNCLHLWRPMNEPLPTPPSIMVGIRKGQSASSAIEEMNCIGTATCTDRPSVFCEGKWG